MIRNRTRGQRETRADGKVLEFSSVPLPDGAVRLYESKNHTENFFDCVRSRQAPVCDVETGHRSATMCHLGAISMRTGRSLTWDAKALTFRGTTYDAAHHAPVLVFPNPLSTQQRYVVLNSGIDFREEAYGTNALQVPKLPDYAIVDLREPAGPRWPGKIVTAGFFDSAWK